MFRSCSYRNGRIGRENKNTQMHLSLPKMLLKYKIIFRWVDKSTFFRCVFRTDKTKTNEIFQATKILSNGQSHETSFFFPRSHAFIFKFHKNTFFDEFFSLPFLFSFAANSSYLLECMHANIYLSVIGK